MNSKLNVLFFNKMKNDILASIIVFLVAVPLCFTIALVSIASLYSGLIACSVGGIIVGVLSGSHLGVKGPAAGLGIASIMDCTNFITLKFKLCQK